MFQSRWSVPLSDYSWSVGHLSPCSASCGNKGVQYRQPKCLLDGAQVNISHCMEKPKPALQPVACNRRDCPSRFELPLKCTKYVRKFHLKNTCSTSRLRLYRIEWHHIAGFKTLQVFSSLAACGEPSHLIGSNL